MKHLIVDNFAGGGGDEPENLVTLCVECHKKRHGSDGRRVPKPNRANPAQRPH